MEEFLNKVHSLKALLFNPEFDKDVDKASRGQTAAGVRVRKVMQEAQKQAKEIRSLVTSLRAKNVEKRASSIAPNEF